MPDWLRPAVTVAAVGLAVITIVMMTKRQLPSEDDPGREPASAMRDPMLWASVLVLLGLAIAVWLL